MRVNYRQALTACAALALAALAPLAHAAPITGWNVHNGSSTVGGTASAPTFTGADNITVMAPFDAVTLGASGDSVTVSTTLTVNGRTGTGVNALNTQLRVGLFNGPAGAIVADDVPNTGFIIEYSNLGGLIREQTSAVQTAPFVSPNNLTNTGTLDAGGDSIQGADPGPVVFTLTLTRNGANLDLLGSISGTDSVSGNPYLSTYTQNGIAPSNYTFNRIGLFLGGNVNGASAVITDSTVTASAIPEPGTFALAALGLIGGALVRRQGRRS